MKRYTKADMEKFRRDVFGNLICPTGDYSLISGFGEYCKFDARCTFRSWSRFGTGCSFGEECSFGEDCSFGERCRFGMGCSFGEECRFGEDCRFGAWNSFGEWCNFSKGCNFEAGEVQNGTYCACDRIGSERRKTYFFRDGDGEMYVRAGCWFSSLDEFVERVKQAHGGTKYEKEYLAAVELAKIVLEG